MYRVLTFPPLTEESDRLRGPMSAEELRAEAQAFQDELNQIGGHIEAVFKRAERATFSYVVVNTD